MGNFRVTAPFVNLKLKNPVVGGAAINGFYKGAIVTDDQIEEASLERHLRRNMMEPFYELPSPQPEASAPAANPDPDAELGELVADGTPGPLPEANPANPDPDAELLPAPPPVKPKQAEGKDAWVDYAVANGVDPGEAEGLTKAELIELFKD